MHIEKFELRNKKSGFMIKQCQFERLNVLKSADEKDALAILTEIRELRKFALGLENNYLDNISRLYFKANHHEYLWFAKTTSQEGWKAALDGMEPGEAMVVDEEEIYNEDNEIIATRGFAQASLKGVETPEINEQLSLLCLFNLSELKEIRRGFANIFSLKVTNKEQLAKISELPHGALVLLEASQMAEEFDLDTLRQDVQIIAVGQFTGGAIKEVVRKGNALSVK